VQREQGQLFNGGELLQRGREVDEEHEEWLQRVRGDRCSGEVSRQAGRKKAYNGLYKPCMDLQTVAVHRFLLGRSLQGNGLSMSRGAVEQQGPHSGLVRTVCVCVNVLARAVSPTLADHVLAWRAGVD